MYLAAGPFLQLGGCVGVDAVDDVGDPERAVLQHLEDLPLTRPAMLQVLVDLRLGLVDDVAVAGRDARHPPLLELLERRDVLGHVAASSGVHDRERAVEDDVAGEQDALLLEQEADVVGRVTGRVDDLEPELGSLDAVAVDDGAVGRHDRVALRERHDLGAGRLHQPLGAGGVVGMCVREEHPPDALAHRRPDDGVDVLLRVGAGVDHGDLVDAHEVRVRAGTRHRARVRGDDAAHERRQRAGDARRHVGHQATPS